MAREGGRGRCAVCSDERQVKIDADLVSGASYGELAKRYGISRPALTAHKQNHLSPALVQVRKKQLAKGATTILGRLEVLIERAEAVMEGGNPAQVLAAIREIRPLCELIAKITGELDVKPTTVINVQTTAEWLELRTSLVEVLAPFPEAKVAVANRLQLLEGTG